ncbi:MAG: twin-arginine translocation signal domain-containing protein, partial [Bacteroidota bacterium]
MTTRRTFLKTSIAGMAGVLLLKNYSCKSENEGLKFGYIAGIVGDEMKEDWKSVLSKTVDYGFSEIEIGSPPDGVSVPDFMEFCRDAGIKPVAGGVPMT